MKTRLILASALLAGTAAPALAGGCHPGIPCGQTQTYTPPPRVVTLEPETVYVTPDPVVIEREPEVIYTTPEPIYVEREPEVIYTDPEPVHHSAERVIACYPSCAPAPEPVTVTNTVQVIHPVIKVRYPVYYPVAVQQPVLTEYSRYGGSAYSGAYPGHGHHGHPFGHFGHTHADHHVGGFVRASGGCGGYSYPVGLAHTGGC